MREHVRLCKYVCMRASAFIVASDVSVHVCGCLYEFTCAFSYTYASVFACFKYVLAFVSHTHVFVCARVFARVLICSFIF